MIRLLKPLPPRMASINSMAYRSGLNRLIPKCPRARLAWARFRGMMYTPRSNRGCTSGGAGRSRGLEGQSPKRAWILAAISSRRKSPTTASIMLLGWKKRR